MNAIKLWLITACCFLAISSVSAVPVPGCGDLDNGYGPFDYTNNQHYLERLPIVEGAHFTKNVETLRSGVARGSSVLGDLDYTLRAFPNHHRALYSMLKYRLINPKNNRQRAYSIECYFKRAIAFKPDDGVVWMLYGILKYKEKKYKEALDRYRKAENLLENSSELYYNMGLAFFKINDYLNSKKYADKAYALGYRLPGLREQLKKIKKW